MSKDRDERRDTGTLAEILTSACGHLKELAAAYLVLARETMREEIKDVGRRIVCAAGLLVLLALGATFLALGLSRVVRTWLGFEGSGYLITGGASALAALLSLHIMLRRGKR